MRFSFFFFSSRRRHTRWPRDWSSDVCSSDLQAGPDLLIADEATAHLDPDGRRVAFEWLRSEIGAGLAVLWITQEQVEIGRASCRERVERTEGGVTGKKRKPEK